MSTRTRWRCSDNPADADQPGSGHYGWHRQPGTPPMCWAARAANAWAQAERKAGRALPDFQLRQYRLGGYQCGDHPQTPQTGHYTADTKPGRGGTGQACQAAILEQQWHRANRQAGWRYLYWPQPEVLLHQCSDNPEDAEQASEAHYMWDWRRTGTACPKAAREKALAAWVKTGNPAAAYQPAYRIPAHRCGPADLAGGPDTRPYFYHYHRQEPQCDFALAGMAWHNVEVRCGRPVPDYRYKDGLRWDEPCSVYHYLFNDGQGYYGISAQTGHRWRDQEHYDNSPLGGHLRAGVGYQRRVLAVCDDRQTALDLEKQLIRAAAPGTLLNIVHNSKQGPG